MAGLTLLGQVLHEEHFRILMSLSELQSRLTGEAAERPLDPACDDDRHYLRKLIRSLDHMAAHHTFEENVVFPLIRSSGRGELAGILADDHATIEPLIQRLQTLAGGLLRKRLDDVRWAEFRTLGEALFVEMMSHLENEELAILQRLDRLLDSHADQRLAALHFAAQRLSAPAARMRKTG